MSFGVTEQGFAKKTFDDINNEITTAMKTAFGEDFDMRPATPQAQLLAPFSNEDATIWDQLETLYNNMSVDQATGVALSYKVRDNGINRKQAVAATGTITITGEDNSIIPAGFLLKTDTGLQFKTIESGTILSGTITLNIQCLTLGLIGNIAAGAITESINPLAGITSINNANPTSGGLDAESDPALRSRNFKSLALGGGSTPDAIRAALLQVQSVQDAKVRENDTLIISVDGLPPKSIAPVVLGGANQDIFNCLYLTKGGGIQCYGDLTYNFTDESGNIITIAFSRPPLINIWINANVTPGTEYPTDGDAQIKDIIISFINNLEIGTSVILFQILTEIAASVTGINNLTLTSSLDGVTYSDSDISITGINKAVTDTAKVVVI